MLVIHNFPVLAEIIEKTTRYVLIKQQRKKSKVYIIFTQIGLQYTNILRAMENDRWHLEFEEETEQFDSKEINEFITNVCTS